MMGTLTTNGVVNGKVHLRAICVVKIIVSRNESVVEIHRIELPNGV